MELPIRQASSLQPLHLRHIIIRNAVNELVVRVNPCFFGFAFDGKFEGVFTGSKPVLFEIQRHFFLHTFGIFTFFGKDTNVNIITPFARTDFLALLVVVEFFGLYGEFYLVLRALFMFFSPIKSCKA